MGPFNLEWSIVDKCVVAQSEQVSHLAIFLNGPTKLMCYYLIIWPHGPKPFIGLNVHAGPVNQEWVAKRNSHISTPGLCAIMQQYNHTGPYYYFDWIYTLNFKLGLYKLLQHCLNFIVLNICVWRTLFKHPPCVQNKRLKISQIERLTACVLWEINASFYEVEGMRGLPRPKSNNSSTGVMRECEWAGGLKWCSVIA